LIPLQVVAQEAIENQTEETTIVESPVINEDGTVTFYYQGDSSTSSVYIPGSFNGWNETNLAMEEGENNLWFLTIDLTPGVYEYKYIVDGEWISDPENDREEINTNSQLVNPGLIIDASYEIESGESIPLNAHLIDENGDSNTVAASFTLTDPVEGVIIENNTLTVSNEISSVTDIQVVATYEDYEATHTVDILEEVYEYTINYYRPDGNQSDWDLWIWEDGFAGELYPMIETTDDGFSQTTVTFGSNEINLITRLGDWEQQEADRIISVPEGETDVEVWIVGGESEIFYSQEDIEVSDQRSIEFTYIREDGDYEGWNIWVWNTGVQDDEIQFDKITDEGAVANIAIGQGTTEIGFVIRKGDDWAVVDPYGEDRFIQTSPDELVTKVTVREGVGEIHTVPSLAGPVLEDGNVSLFYRDPELYLTNDMNQIEQVDVNVTPINEVGESISETAVYGMIYNDLNEYYEITLEGIAEGTYDYTFSVTRNGETVEVTDPYNTVNGRSTFTYIVPDVSANISVYPEAISYNENAVVSVDLNLAEDVELSRGYVNATPIGGPAEVPIDIELMETTIAVEQSTTAGNKLLDVVLVDEYGNRHLEEVELEVLPRHIKNEADFDWDEARIYFMLTDRFADGDPTNNNPNGEDYDKDHPETYHGGDFQGILDNLDYLDNLGINTIWITPIVDNIDWNMRHDKEGDQYGYHGYWTEDFTQLDEHLGDLETFKELIDSAHDRGIKIMVDVVLNHTGYGLKSTDSGTDISNYPTDEDRATFEGLIRENPVPGDDQRGELDGLPDLRTEDPAVREQIVGWQTDWLERARTDRGDTIDYFRVDTVKHVDNTTWNDFKNELTKIKPDFKMIGEWFGASINNTGDQLQSGRMDSLLDFEFKNQAAAFIHGNIEGIEADLANRNQRIDNTAMMGQFLSSHDEDGFLVTHANNDEGLHKVAAALQITAKGQPVIYYGEEIGMSGVSAGNMDNLEFSENRDDFDWNLVNKDNKMLEHYQKLLNIRADYSDIFSKGSRNHLAGTNETGYSIFARTYGEQTVLVGLNTNEDAGESTFDVNLSGGTEVIDIYNNVAYTVSDEQTLTVDLPGNVAGGTAVFVTEDTVEMPKEPGEEIDTSQLEDLISEADGYVEANQDYTEESIIALEEAIASANTALGEIITEENLAEVLANLQTAIDNLVVVEDSGTVAPGEDKVDESNTGETSTNDSIKEDDSNEANVVKEDTTGSGEEDDLPSTGETSNVSIYILGISLIGGGLILIVKMRKEARE